VAVSGHGRDTERIVFGGGREPVTGPLRRPVARQAWSVCLTSTRQRYIDTAGDDAMQPTSYPVQFTVDYPDRPLNRATTAFRLLTAIPIAIVLGLVSGATWQWSNSAKETTVMAGAGGLLVAAPALMILFRQVYPRWWFDWNLELQRFANRVAAYIVLMDDRYPSTMEHQSVRLEYVYPDAERDLNRWLPLVKWFLAIPHYVVLVFLEFAAVFVVIAAWFAIVFTGRYPRAMFDFVEGVLRWHNRVLAYAFLMVTDTYPPFRLAA
jgi:hypothetical protein